MKDTGYHQLQKLEHIFKTQVDPDFFQDPKQFVPLTRVIDVLGAQLLDEASNNGGGATKPLNIGANNLNNNPLVQNDAFDDLHQNNPAYTALRKQQDIIEKAIEHLSVNHCSDLNSSVVAVGMVSKKFDDAVGQVKGLRRQVQEIRNNLASHASINPNDGDAGAARGDANNQTNNGNTTTKKNINHQGGNSLRELWLKKLESEAVLSLLQKIEVIRRTPQAFDALIHSRPCRIGASVVLLANATKTAFQYDVAQVKALQNIGGQLMTRKERVVEILWETLQDVLYLRTGNGGGGGGEKGGEGDETSSKDQNNTPTATTDSIRRSTRLGGRHRKQRFISSGYHHNRRHGTSTHSDDETHTDSDSDSDHDSISILSGDFSNRGGGSVADSKSRKHKQHQQQQQQQQKPQGVNQRMISTGSLDNLGGVTDSAAQIQIHGYAGRLLPRAMLESELDLEVDEMRALESSTNSNNNTRSTSTNSNTNQNPTNDGDLSYMSTTGIPLPRYTDSILALRILIESLAILERLDDVERTISENVERELRGIAALEQAKTLARLEKLRVKGGNKGGRRGLRVSVVGGGGGGGVTGSSSGGGDGDGGGEEDLKEFRIHLRSLLRAFGSVMLRLSHLTQILRHRIASDARLSLIYSTKTSALHSILVTAKVTMQREIKGFLRGCLNPSTSPFQNQKSISPLVSASTHGTNASSHNSTSHGFSHHGTFHGRNARNMASSGVSAHEQGIFSLGIISDANLASSVRAKYAQNISSASRSSAMQMTHQEFVTAILCPRTENEPAVRHALYFRKNIATWTSECDDLKRELSNVTNEDTSSPSYNATTEETALDFLDDIVKNNVLPTLTLAAETGVLAVLERSDAFEPILRSGIYSTPLKSQDRTVAMCRACETLYSKTGPLFSALERLPRQGEMFSPLVANLEVNLLVFTSRIKGRERDLCDGKTAFRLLEEVGSKLPTQFSMDMEAKKPFSSLWNAYFDTENQGLMGGGQPDTPNAGGINRTSLSMGGGGGGGPIHPLSPSKSDTKSKHLNYNGENEDGTLRRSLAVDLTSGTDLEREQETFEQEVMHLVRLGLVNFSDAHYGENISLCTEDEFLKAGSLAHSLLTVASLLEKRLTPKKVTWGKSVASPRALKECIKTIRMHGLRVAKFCRVEVLLQTVKRMSQIYKSSSLTSKDAIRLPSIVNDLGEYLTSISDLLREYGGNKITAYSLSSLEQYIPLFLIETVRILAEGEESLYDEGQITLYGVEALDRSCSVLYRDLKGATTFDNSFWDDDVAADAFERAAGYVNLMELDIEELVSYCRTNRNEFTDVDYKMMFSMNAPRRKGDVTRFTVLKEQLGEDYSVS